MFSILEKTLNGALGEPLLGTMNFLNEITMSFPEAISLNLSELASQSEGI